MTSKRRPEEKKKKKKKKEIEGITLLMSSMCPLISSFDFLKLILTTANTKLLWLWSGTDVEF
jgi:hypothetical protein